MPAIPKPTRTEIATREKELVEHGWTKQFSTLVDGLDEYIELYTQIGYQVQVELWTPTQAHDPSCRECEMSGLVRTVFVRKPPA